VLFFTETVFGGLGLGLEGAGLGLGLGIGTAGLGLGLGTLVLTTTTRLVGWWQLCIQLPLIFIRLAVVFQSKT